MSLFQKLGYTTHSNSNKKYEQLVKILGITKE